MPQFCTHEKKRNIKYRSINFMDNMVYISKYGSIRYNSWKLFYNYELICRSRAHEGTICVDNLKSFFLWTDHVITCICVQYLINKKKKMNAAYATKQSYSWFNGLSTLNEYDFTADELHHLQGKHKTIYKILFCVKFFFH
jgi:hypothetical protein